MLENYRWAGIDIPISEEQTVNIYSQLAGQLQLPTKKFTSASYFGGWGNKQKTTLQRNNI